VAEPDVAREAKDILRRKKLSVVGNGLIERFGLDLPPIVGQLPSDLPVLEVRAQQADLLHLLADDSLLDTECQSSYAYEDLLRFGDYSWSAFRQHNKRTRTLVLYGPAVTVEPPTEVDAGGHVFRLTQVLLSKQDGDAALARLERKVARGEPLDAVDRVDLALMAHRRPLEEVVAEVLPVVRALPASEQAEMVGTIIGLGYTGREESVAMALLEAFKMANALEELIAEGIVQGRQEGLAAGRQEGQVEGKRAALRRLVERRFGPPPPVLEQRIAAADEAALDELFDRAITIETLAEL
jgi:hypothetical protein